jgi:hypothetical protein
MLFEIAFWVKRPITKVLVYVPTYRNFKLEFVNLHSNAWAGTKQRRKALKLFNGNALVMSMLSARYSLPECFLVLGIAGLAISDCVRFSSRGIAQLESGCFGVYDVITLPHNLGPIMEVAHWRRSTARDRLGHRSTLYLAI